MKTHHEYLKNKNNNKQTCKKQNTNSNTNKDTYISCCYYYITIYMVLFARYHGNDLFKLDDAVLDKPFQLTYTLAWKCTYTFTFIHGLACVFVRHSCVCDLLNIFKCGPAIH